jgi:hypothetical protein
MKLSEIIVQELNKAHEEAGKEEKFTLVKSEKLFMGENDTQWRTQDGRYADMQ